MYVGHPPHQDMPLILTQFYPASFEAVRDFIEGKIQITGGKPYLYCNSDWLTRFTMQDEWLNDEGQPELRTDEQGIPYYVRNKNVEHMVDKQTESTRALGQVAVPVSIYNRSIESI